MHVLIFLDFDGVLRRATSNPSRFDSDCLGNFEAVVRQYVDLKIVISSTWRLAIPLKELRKYFSPDIATRIVGITPEIYEEEIFERYEEIMAYLEGKGMFNTHWIAIDDNPEHFPKNKPVVFADPNKGFDAECTVRLRNFLDSFTFPPDAA